MYITQEVHHPRSDYRTKREEIAAIKGAHVHWYGKA
jgi:phosphoribosylaminoimidazole carboxylase (NCAIR synthetase)